MPLNLPHEFSQLRIGQRRPFLVVGAGMSCELVDLPTELFNKKHIDAESYLGCKPPSVTPSDTVLFKWASDIYAQLCKRGDILPKLSIARSLGIVDDPRWTAKVRVNLRGTTPRHRVIARLARESRWVSIWSLNWDTYLEDALEHIGFDRDEPKYNQPWCTAYRSIVTLDDFDHVPRPEIFCVFKPHGCAHALIKSQTAFDSGDKATAKIISERFLITESEMFSPQIDPTYKKFISHLKNTLYQSPLFVAGWRIAEPYLGAIFDKKALQGLLKTATLEEFTIADITFNKAGHTQTADCYDLTRDQVYAEVESKPDGFNLDKLFLDIQAKYALDHLKKHAPASVKNIIESYTSSLTISKYSDFLIGFSDDYLPAWMRLCWRAGLVPCGGFQPHQLRLELEDQHVPSYIPTLPGLERPDLAAASILLACLLKHGGNWNSFLFPGGILYQTRLILPLPAWSQLNDLTSLKPLVKILARRKGLITSFEILPLPSKIDEMDTMGNEIEPLKLKVARDIGINEFNIPAKIGVADDLLTIASGLKNA